MWSAISGKRLISISAISVFCFLLFGGVEPAPADNAGEKEPEAAAAKEAGWTEDLDAKIDKTIQVLDVVKEELKEYKKVQKASEAAARPGVPAEEEKAMAASLREKLRTALRVWRRVREVVKEETEAVRREEAVREEAEWARSVSEKLDATIETIAVIKEELAEMEEKGAE